MITPAQWRAARALLDESRADLAKQASVSIAYIVRLESGSSRVPGDVQQTVREHYEASGVVFVSDEAWVGVHLRNLPLTLAEQPGAQTSDELARGQRLSQAEAAVQDASLSVHRQRERIEALKQSGDIAVARSAKAELEMLEDSLRRRILERDAIARDVGIVKRR